MEALMLLGFVVLGAIFGGIAKPKDALMKALNKVQFGLVYALIFMMGVKMGGDGGLMARLAMVGLSALVYTLAALLGCFSLIKLLERLVFKRFLRVDAQESPERAGGGRVPPSVWLALDLAAGFGAGRFLPAAPVLDPWVMGCLCGMLWIAGADIIRSRDALRYLKQAGAKILIVPLGALTGSVLGCVLLSLALGDIRAAHAACVGAGLGWYTYSGVVLAKINVELGAIAFFANFFRELGAYLFMPIVAKTLGPYCAVAMPGSPAMDSSMPVVIRSAGKSMTIVCFISGLLCTLLTPVCFSVFLAIAG